MKERDYFLLLFVLLSFITSKGFFLNFHNLQRWKRTSLLASVNKISTTSPTPSTTKTNGDNRNNMVEIFSQMDDNLIIDNENASKDSPSSPMSGEVISKGTWIQDAITEIHTIIEYLLDVDRKSQQQVKTNPSTSSLSSQGPTKGSFLSSGNRKASTPSSSSASSSSRSMVGGLQSINPQLLLDKSDYLCKEGIYDTMINYRLSELQRNLKKENDDDGDEGTKNQITAELLSLKRVHSFLQGFIFSEKKSRARLKINYLLAGAEIGQIENAINKLSLGKEIDQFLLSYLSQLINSEQTKLKAAVDNYPVSSLFQNISRSIPAASSSLSSQSESKENERQLSLQIIDQNLQQLTQYLQQQKQQQQQQQQQTQQDNLYLSSLSSSSSSEVDELIAKNNVLKILLLIERRLKAELKYSSSFEMKLLGELINIQSSEDRMKRMKQVLNTIERMELFEDFLQSGINYVQNNGFLGKEESNSRNSIELSPEKLQIMKELLYDFHEIRKKLLTGYEDSRTVFQVKSEL